MTVLRLRWSTVIRKLTVLGIEPKSATIELWLARPSLLICLFTPTTSIWSPKARRKRSAISGLIVLTLTTPTEYTSSMVSIQILSELFKTKCSARTTLYTINIRRYKPNKRVYLVCIYLELYYSIMLIWNIGTTEAEKMAPKKYLCRIFATSRESILPTLFLPYRQQQLTFFSTLSEKHVIFLQHFLFPSLFEPLSHSSSTCSLLQHLSIPPRTHPLNIFNVSSQNCPPLAVCWVYCWHIRFLHPWMHQNELYS